MRRYNNKIYYSPFITFGQLVQSKEDFLISFILFFNPHQLFSTLLMAIRISKGKLDTFNHFIEHEIELKDEFFILVES